MILWDMQVISVGALFMDTAKELKIMIFSLY